MSTYCFLHCNFAMVYHLLKRVLALAYISPLLDLRFLILLNILICLLTALRWAINSIHTRIFLLLHTLGIEIAKGESNKAHVYHEHIAHKVQIIYGYFVQVANQGVLVLKNSVEMAHTCEHVEWDQQNVNHYT